MLTAVTQYLAGQRLLADPNQSEFPVKDFMRANYRALRANNLYLEFPKPVDD